MGEREGQGGGRGADEPDSEPRKATRDSTPEVVPPPRPRRPAGRRVTLDFTGPPLALPGDELVSFDDPESGVLELDTTELEPRGSGGTDEQTLDLDLTGLDESHSTPAATSDGHDAWTVDRMARQSTIPPAPGSSSRPAPRQWDEPSTVPSQSGSGSPSSNPLPPADGEGDALELVDRSTPSHHGLDFASEMADRYALGDFTGALQAAELVLGRNPDHREAQRYAQSCRERLEHLYSSRLGSLRSVPVLDVPESEVRWLGVDHRAGFILARVDGSHSIEQLLDMGGMARLEALKTLSELLDLGVIRLES